MDTGWVGRVLQWIWVGVLRIVYKNDGIMNDDRLAGNLLAWYSPFTPVYLNSFLEGGLIMRETRAWFLVIAIVIVAIVAAIAIVQAVRGAAQSALAPFQEGATNMQTQVAQMLNPTPTVIPDPISIIREIRTLARLETIQYSVEKVITAETAQGFFRPLFGDRLLFVAHGIVIAGIDLEKLTPENLSVENGVITVLLPEAEIFVSTLDNDKSYVYDRETGLLTHGDVNLETTARQAAEDEITRTAIEDGIILQAQRNAESYIDRLLRELGYADVIFVNPAPAPEPDD